MCVCFIAASKVPVFEDKSGPVEGNEVINFVADNCDFIIKEARKVVPTEG